jgi:hypothetical protein
MAEPHNPERTLDQRIEQVHVEVGEHFIEMRDFISYNITKVRQELDGVRRETGALRREMVAGFSQVDGQFRALRQEMAAGFGRSDERFARSESRFERLESKLDRVLSTRSPGRRRPKRGR